MASDASSALPTDVVLEGDALEAALKKQIEFYFSRENLAQDHYLWSCMDAELFVAVDVIAAFKKVVKLTTDRALLLKVMRASNGVALSDDETRVKPSTPAARNTIVLFDVPAGVTDAEVRALFADQAAALVEVRPERNGLWYVKFTDEETTSTAFLAARTKSIAGGPVHCRIKNESLFPPPRPTAPIFYPAMPEGMDPAMLYGGPGYGMYAPAPGYEAAAFVPAVQQYDASAGVGRAAFGGRPSRGGPAARRNARGGGPNSGDRSGPSGGGGGASRGGGSGGSGPRRGGAAGSGYGSTGGAGAGAAGGPRGDRDRKGRSPGGGAAGSAPASSVANGTAAATPAAASATAPAAQVDTGISNFPPLPASGSAKGSAPKSSGYSAPFVHHTREALLAVIRAQAGAVTMPTIPAAGTAVLVPKGQFGMEVDKPLPDPSQKRKVKSKAKRPAAATAAAGSGGAAVAAAAADGGRGRSGSAGRSADAGVAPAPAAAATVASSPAAVPAAAAAPTAAAPASPAAAPAASAAPASPAAASTPAASTASPTPAAATSTAAAAAAAAATPAVSAAPAAAPAPAAADANGPAKKPTYADLLRK